jgi:hypothetical protein
LKKKKTSRPAPGIVRKVKRKGMTKEKGKREIVGRSIKQPQQPKAKAPFPPKSYFLATF